MRALKSILFITFLNLALSISLHASTIVFGTFEINTDAKNTSEKYSLKNLGSLTHKTSTFIL